MLISLVNISHKSKRIIFGALMLAVITVPLLLSLEPAYAFSANYNPSNLIDNPTFTDTSTMSALDIQAFLNNIGSGLANYSDVEACDSTITPYYTHCGQTISAAQIIYDASQAYGINPRVILATLEKEQSLITDPSPSSSQINCAMGYHSCSGYVGFFTQVDNGTWVLKYNYEGAFQTANWLSWSPGANYPCANASSFYSAGLYPGNAVTFSDSGGTAETVTLANAATASLYCYTPYVGPYSLTGYSGSYNFVYYFQLWFGSTQVSTAYAWQYDGIVASANSAYTEPYTGSITVAPGADAYIQLEARNVGYQYWTPSIVHLGTSSPDDRSSQFYDTSWLGATRPAAVSQSSVAPGADGTFDFILHAPAQTGTYLEHFNLVAEGITWLNDLGLYIAVDVVSPTTPTNSANTGLTANQYINVSQNLLSPDTQSTLNLEPNGDLVLNSDFQSTWSNGVNSTNASASFVVMQPDGNLVEYDNSGQALWSSGTTGSGNYLSLQTDGNLVIYNSSGSPLWSSNTSSTPNHLSKVNEVLPSSSIMYPGQSLQTATRGYSLVMQPDGNLVEYDNSGQALWSSGTTGSGNFAAMQGDGNFVIYNSSGKALWSSGTNGGAGNYLMLQPDGTLNMMGPSGDSILWGNRVLSSGQSLQTTANGYFLVMQPDGNLVEYDNSGQALWSSGTTGSGNFAAMQGDGNFVIYNSSGKALWSSGTNGRQNAALVLQGNGSLDIYSTSGAAWSAGS
jgi:hypothetical protein